MAKAEKPNPATSGVLVDIGLHRINIYDETQKVVMLNNRQIWPIVAAVHGVHVIATNNIMDLGGLVVLSEIVKKLGLKPGKANPSGKLLPKETGLGGLVLAGLMANNGDALITTPHNLPYKVNWNRLAKEAAKIDIQNEFINIHHLFEAQCAHDYGFQDWRAPNLKCEDNADESRMLWKFSNAGGSQLFSKSEFWTPASTFWAARRHSNLETYHLFLNKDNNYEPIYCDSSMELPVRPVRRVDLLCARGVSPSP